ncbi:MAG: hypothetical protein HY376_02625 [Candidatus Blackburnbacteria bacterium]|nr:hypothetical protein [Candidatus Blackburnbacteria bacterium]
MRLIRQMRAQAAVELGARAFQIAKEASSGFNQKTVSEGKLRRIAGRVAQQLDPTQLVWIIAAKAKRPLLGREVETLDDLVSFVTEILEAYAWESMLANGYRLNDVRTRDRFEKVELKNSGSRKAVRAAQGQGAFTTDEQTREEIRHPLD